MSNPILLDHWVRHLNHELTKEKLNKKESNQEFKRILVWYLVFIFLFPILIIHLWSFDSLRFYLSILDILANIFASVNQGKWMGTMYSLLPINIVSYLSTNFLNLLALIGTSWTSITYAFQTKSIINGVMVATIMFTITYLLPSQGIGYVIEKLDTVFYENITSNDITAGFLFLFTLLLVENILVYIYFRILYLF